MIKKCLLKRILLIFTFIFTFFLFLNNFSTCMPKLKSQNKNYLLSFEIQQEKKYISCTFKACSGIGNQMFRFASLFAIGKYFNRSVFYSSESECQKNYMSEIKATFPKMYENIKLLLPDSNKTLKTDFGINCCKYYDPNDMHDVPEKYLILTGNYLQSYKYFDRIKSEIRNIFDFSQTVKKTVQQKGRSLFMNDVSHKLCIHIRRGDFLEHFHLESRAEFIEPAIKFLYQNLTNKQISKISAIFLGNDIPFSQSLNFNRDLFHSIHYVNMKTRGEDMYFGIRYCDTLLITASGSTFAWWIGYLLPKSSQIFYNAQVSKTRTADKDLYDFDFFPKTWTMLEFYNSTNTVGIDNRWHYEKFGWP